MFWTDDPRPAEIKILIDAIEKRGPGTIRHKKESGSTARKNYISRRRSRHLKLRPVAPSDSSQRFASTSEAWWETFEVLPDPWRSILLEQLKPQNGEPHPGFYIVAHYCAMRAQRFDVIPRDRDQWRALHSRCLGAMKLNAAARPSKELPRITGDLLKLAWGDLRKDLLALESREMPLSFASVQAILQQRFEDWTVPDAFIAEVIKDRSVRRGRSWSGLQSLLAEWAGISLSLLRRQVTETSR